RRWAGTGPAGPGWWPDRPPPGRESPRPTASGLLVSLALFGRRVLAHGGFPQAASNAACQHAADGHEDGQKSRPEQLLDHVLSSLAFSWHVQACLGDAH